MAVSSTELQDEARSDNPSQVFTNTSLGGLIYKACATNQSITIPQYTTLNEYFNLFGDLSLGKKNARDFELKYFTLGIRGSNTTGQNALGVDVRRVNAHQPYDANLFTMVPLCARPVSNDLDATTMAKYRLRVIETHNGIDYAIYYAMLINFDNYNPNEILITRDPDTGNESSDPYIHQKKDLFNAQPVSYGSNGTVTTSNQYLNGSAILDCSLDANALAELVNAVKITLGDPSLASINEVAILWGIDSQQTGSVGSGSGASTIRYWESLSTVIAHFLSEQDGRNANNNSYLELKFDHGNSDPLLVYTDTTTSSTGS